MVGVGWVCVVPMGLNLPTNIVDFRGFDSSIILIERGGIPKSIGISSSLTQAMLVGTMLVGTMLVGRLGVDGSRPRSR